MGTGAKIGEVAKQQKVSLKELSRRIEMPYTTLYHIVSRDSRIDIATVAQIAKALGVDMTTFYSEDELQIVGFRSNTELWDPLEASKKEEQEFLKDFRNLNPKGKGEAKKRVHELTLIPEYQVEVINKPTDTILEPIGVKKSPSNK